MQFPHIIVFSILLGSFSAFANSFEVGTHRIDIPEQRTGQYDYQIDGQNFSHSGKIRLRRSAVDPNVFNPSLVPYGQRLFVVQFSSLLLPEYLKTLAGLNIEVIKFVPDHAVLVIAHDSDIKKLRLHPFVSQVIDYDATYKIVALTDQIWLQPNRFISLKVDLLLANRKKSNEFVHWLKKQNIVLINDGQKSFAVRVELTVDELKKVVQHPQVLWVEEMPGAPELDMDVVLKQGGVTQLIQDTGSYMGEGIRGHVLEGVFVDHPDFAADAYRDKPIAIGDDSPDGHGQKTFGIIYGSGQGDATATGLMPKAQGYYTHRNEVYQNDVRFKLTEDLINNHQVMLQTASWGYPTTTEYTARSLEMDQIIFELDIPVTQSQSNRSSKQSRPQAWAKNIISVGAVHHGNDLDFDNDSWNMGGASIGPASDGRIKPDLVSYYDNIHTTTSTSYGSFGGTSAATPIVNGHLGLVIEMFTDGVFGNALEFPVKERFLNRPHAATSKALLINSARPYDFSGTSHDMARVHQGWGHPSLGRLYDRRDKTLVVDESETLQVLQSKTYRVRVQPDQGDLRATLVYSDPPGLVGAEKNRVNDLDLILTSPSGEIYLGNFGLTQGPYSKPQGSKDDLNTVENVFIAQPEPGEWTVQVFAAEINQDGHLETSQLDVDFALVISGIEY